jgi:hypothetical protein
MPHPITDILRQVLDGDDAALDAFKRQLWHRPFWVAGTNKLVNDSAVQITMNLADPVNGTNSIMRVFVDKAEAEAEHGADGCFPMPFRVILVFAESSRMDAYLHEHDEGLLITHDQLMALRDQVAMGGQGIPMSEQEVLQHRALATALATRARAYCAAQDDIETLYLSVVMVPGVKAMVAAKLKASGRKQEHVDALTAISQELLRPRWRFAMYEDGEGSDGMGGMLKQHQPCFSRERDTGMWNKFKNAFSAPVLGIVQIQMDPDPTAMALENSEVPEWAEQHA